MAIPFWSHIGKCFWVVPQLTPGCQCGWWSTTATRTHLIQCNEFATLGGGSGKGSTSRRSVQSALAFAMDHVDHSSHKPNRFKVEKLLLRVYLSHGRLLAAELIEVHSISHGTSRFAISSLNVKHLRSTIAHENWPLAANSVYVQQPFSMMIQHYHF